jgi:hypothetical protein
MLHTVHWNKNAMLLAGWGARLKKENRDTRTTYSSRPFLKGETLMRYLLLGSD